MVPNRMDSTNQKRRPSVSRAHCDIYQAGLPWQGMAKLYKCSIFHVSYRRRMPATLT